MSENEEVKAKIAMILEKIQDLSNAEILKSDNFTFWSGRKTVTTSQGHGNGNPPTPPPPPPPPPEG